MKRFIIGAMACLSAAAASASIDVPTYFQSDFKEYNDISIPWTMYGVDSRPDGVLASWFMDYSAENSYFVKDFDNRWVALSFSEFEGGVESDQWLVTPAFRVPEENFMIVYELAGYGSRTENKYRILLSGGGELKEDFTEEIIDASLNGMGNDLYSFERTRVVSGHKDEDIRLAFVNAGNKVGLLGLESIRAVPYYIKVDDISSYSTITFDGDDMTVGMTVRLSTCEDVYGFTAVLKTSSGFETSYVSEKKFLRTKIKSETFVFPEAIDMKGLSKNDYTITITPNYEGAAPTVIQGVMLRPENVFPRPAVIEEFTGTWCMNCPWGFGVLNYFQNVYDGSDGLGKVFGMAIHNQDPMAVDGIEDELKPISYPLGFSGYPGFMINRDYECHPMKSFDPVRETISSLTYLDVDITGVRYDIETRQATIGYNATMSIDAENMPFNVFVVLTQNKMSGKGSAWAQASNVSSYTSEDVDEIVDGLSEYMAPFIDGAGSSIRGLEYEDVVRMVYPSVTGSVIINDYVGMQPTAGVIEFEIPELIEELPVDMENCELTVVFAGESAEIVSADRMGYGQFEVYNSGIAEVSDNGVFVRSERGEVNVSAPDNSIAEIYSVDGRLLVKADINGAARISMEGERIVIVKVVTMDDTVTRKVLLY